ncbi:MAG TPA: DnaJ domain-containing protein [Pyrinomonadaceae bacterium]|nr:DnaJ domain-containing protein [Pyrinomonadaceae bacterium]
MNGQLSHEPLAKLIRDISAKSQSGCLRIEQDRIRIAAYFYKGHLVYAACNLRDLRLRSHLQRTSLLSPEQLARFDENLPDIELAKNLCNANVLTHGEVEEAQMKQVSDIVRFALTLSDGSWTFDSRAHLNESVNLNIDIDALLVWAEKRAPAEPVEGPANSEPDTETFLERLRTAESHYDVLGVETSAAAETVKSAYYDLARRYHPDRFRKADPSLLTRLESAFARITQAYDTLRDDDLRANYNAKLQARRKAQQIADATAKPIAATTETSATTEDVPQVSVAQRAENDFKEGLAALEQGQRKLAAGLFASAARLVPNEARYRAYYGQLLAGQETTRRAAEAELQAAIKLDPGNANYRVMLAQLFRDLGFSVRAKGEAERAVAADPNNQKARDLLRELKGV